MENFEADKLPIRSGAGDASYLAPFYDQLLTYFSKLMDSYQAQEEEL